MELADTHRLRAIARSGLLDGDDATRVAADRYARIVRRMLGADAALISVVLDDQQVFTGVDGLRGAMAAVRGTTIDASFCQHVVTGERPFVVLDSASDERVVDNAAIGSLDVMAYCGVPLTDGDGVTLGAVCAIENEPRAWTQQDVEALTDVAAGLRDYLVARRALDDLEAAERRERAALDVLGRVDEQLDDAIADESRTRELLARFADVVAHDLRSPIATAVGLVETLGRDDVDAEQVAMLGASARRTLGRALSLLDRLHDHARVGSVEVGHAPVDLNVVLHGVLEDLSAAIEGAGLTVTQHAMLPVVPGDAALLGQMLSNVVGNAVDHATVPDGPGAQLWIDVTHGDRTAHLVIADDGPGIPTDVVADLFAPGVRVPESAGLGLGLATAHAVVDRHGGRMWVGASSTGGAAIHVELPTLVPADRRALVVEHDPDTRTLHRTALRGHEGLTVRAVASIAEARRLLDEEPLRTGDLAILDVSLPDGDPLPLVAELITAGVQVHVVSVAERDDDAMLEALALGATVTSRDHLAWDLPPAMLLAGPTGDRVEPVAGPLPTG